jgi:hypothetical protein
LVKASSGVPVTGKSAPLPELVERAGAAARFAWDEFFYAEHHNPHTQQAYRRAVRRFQAWVEGEGVELVGITPGMVGQYGLPVAGGQKTTLGRVSAGLRSRHHGCSLRNEPDVAPETGYTLNVQVSRSGPNLP